MTLISYVIMRRKRIYLLQMEVVFKKMFKRKHHLHVTLFLIYMFLFFFFFLLNISFQSDKLFEKFNHRLILDASNSRVRSLPVQRSETRDNNDSNDPSRGSLSA